MLQTAEFQQVIERHAGEIEDLRTIARLHGLPTGAPEHLLGLPLRLAKDSRLRSDLTELVRSLQASDPELALPDVLAIFLTAIGGSPSLHRRRDLEECLDLTGGFLASLGGWPGSAVEPTIDIDNPPDHDPRLDLAASADTEALQADLARPATHKEEVVATPSPAAGRQDEASRDPNGTVTLAEITHALARLERGNLELRLHLDSIDQRICRMEPLLEAAPHAEPAQPPEPPRRDPQTSLSTAYPQQLVAREVSAPVSRPQIAPEPDPLDDIKRLRRISLTSNFVDQAPLVPNAPSPVAATSASPIAPLPLADPPAVHLRVAHLPGALADPVSHPRMQPRRDRFAAARELPGTSAETDPLYQPTEEELATLGLSARSGVRETSPTAEPAAEAVPAAPAPARPELRNAPLREEAVEELRLPPAPPNSASQGRNFLAPLEAPTEPIPSPSFGNTEAFWAAEDEDARPRSRAGAWLAGLAVTAVVGAAGFLYVNGLPSVVNQWMSGSSGSTVASSADAETPAAAGASAPSASRERPTNSGTGSASRAASATSPTAHAGSAREGSTANASIDRTSGPTFVPGGIMDGYLISAPRPVYPEMARLVGAQGKVTFEAMVSKEGQVEAVKALGGPQVLRSAATDAVKQWQYRPFQLRGRPVEVRTIIRVDVGSHAGPAAANE